MLLSYYTDCDILFVREGYISFHLSSPYNNNNNNNNNNWKEVLKPRYVLTTLWNQKVQTDRTCPNTKPDITIPKQFRKCMRNMPEKHAIKELRK